MGVKSGSSLFTAAYFFVVTVYFKTFWKPCDYPIAWWRLAGGKKHEAIQNMGFD